MVQPPFDPPVPIDQQFCGGCIAFKPDPNDPSHGTCHLYPPQMVLTIPIGGATYSDPHPAWTEVAAGEWCYQWEPKP